MSKKVVNPISGEEFTAVTVREETIREVSPLELVVKTGHNVPMNQWEDILHALNISYRRAVTATDYSLYILIEDKPYISLNFSKKGIVAFSRKLSAHLPIFTDTVGEHTSRKKASIAPKDVIDIIRTM